VQSINSQEDAEVSEVNVTPLADVTLVLLIMLMIISPMVLQSMIQVQAAQAVAQQSAQSEKPLFVDITKNGFKVNNQVVGTEYELFRVLQTNLSQRKDKTVMVSAAPDVVYQNVVRILDLVRQSGAVSLSLVPRKVEANSGSSVAEGAA
jgi:biopolymer transport protein ExbD